MLQTDSQKLFISSLLHGKWISQGGCQSFLQCFWWSAEAGGDEGWGMAFRDATPETWCTQSHCLIRLSIQLTLLYHRGQGSNQFNMVAGGGTATQQWVQPTYEHMQHWSRHMGHNTVRDFIFPTLQCYCFVMYCHIIFLIVPKTFGECVTSSAHFVGNHDTQTKPLQVYSVELYYFK